MRKQKKFEQSERSKLQNWLLETSGKNSIADFTGVFGGYSQQYYQACNGLQPGLLRKLINHSLRLKAKRENLSFIEVNKKDLSDFITREIFKSITKRPFNN
jgi:hypothetical protein